MAELMILAKDTSPGFSKGSIIEIRANDAPRGAGEGLPDFVFVKIPEVTIAQCRQYIQRWVVDLRFERLSSDLNTATYQYRLYSATPGAYGDGNLTQSHVEQYLSTWGVTSFSVSPNSVEVSFSIADLVRTPRFWGFRKTTFPNGQNVSFSLLNYAGDGGDFEFAVDYSATGINPTHVEVKAEERGATIISHVAKVIELRMSCDDVLQIVAQKIKSDSETFFIDANGRRGDSRYLVPPETVDQIAGAGGEVTRTAAQVAAALYDRMS